MRHLGLGSPAIAVAVVSCCATLMAGAALAQTPAAASASSYGESVSLHVLPLLGSVVTVASGPLPTAAIVSPPAADVSHTTASAGVSTALTGNILGTGILLAHAGSTVPGGATAVADATVNGLGVNVVGILPLLTLGADSVVASASGACADGILQPSGSSTLTNLRLGGTLGLGLHALANPLPNTVLLDVAGIRVVLNEQTTISVGGAPALSVNAIHISLDALPITGLGAVTGDIVISHAQSQLGCEQPELAADLGVGMSGPTSGTVGESPVYQITVSNAGPSPAQQVVFSDVIPAGASLVSAVPSQGTCSGTSTVTCNLGSIAAGGSATVALTLRMGAAGTIVDWVNVSSATPDPNSANNQAMASIVVQNGGGGGGGSAADLSATVTATPNPCAVDTSLTVMTTVTNHGPYPATGVTLASTLPDHGDLVSAAPAAGSCTADGATCDLGTLASGQSVKVTMVLRPRVAGTAIFHAQAASGVADPDSSNNGGTALVSVTQPTSTGGPATHECSIDVVPAATLLIPYFEVDLDNPGGKTTLFSVVNAFAAPHLVQVTIWTNWGIPALSFPVYLTGFDAQSFNLRDLLDGLLPTTGPGISPSGEFSAPDPLLAGCPAGAAVTAALSADSKAHVHAWLTGGQSPISHDCAAAASPSGLATGYVTVDVVRSCSHLTPADAGYFGPQGVATDDNVLWGDFMLIDSAANTAKGDAAVHIVAEPNTYTPGQYTFYGRYVNGDGSDHRRPLGTSYAGRILSGGAFGAGTEMLVWRDTKAPAGKAVACGSQPAWAPLSQGGMTMFDEQENASGLAAATDRLPLATQRLSMGDPSLVVPFNFGWFVIDLGHRSASGLFGNAAQGWVTMLVSAQGRLSNLGERAVRLSSACDPI